MMNKLIKPVGTLTLFCLLMISASCRNTDSKSLSTAAEPKKTVSSKVEIVKTQNGFQLLVNNQPFFIKGAGGSLYMDKLAKAGGNSIRTWDSEPQALDEAYAKGLYVLFGLPIGLPREGFNYSDQTAVTEQFEEIRQTVLKFKDHPALLMWGIGNEVDGYASDEDRIKIFKETNRIAEMIKQIDGNHPVITVVAGTGLEEEGHQKLAEIEQYCPALDAVGINIYGRIKEIPQNAKVQDLDKPYIITEFGPRGWWQVNKTSWGLPIEETSTEKGKFYLEAYRYTIENNPACLGSYVFYWGDKQEKTHTWFGLFLPDGSPTDVVDAMSLAWTGKWPANRCPIIGPRKMQIDALDASLRSEKHIYKPKTLLSCTIDANDPEGDPLTIKWELRRDVSDAPQIGGDPEKPTPPIDGAVVSTNKNQAVIQLPAKKGNYRIFVYVYDNQGHAATANTPIACRK